MEVCSASRPDCFIPEEKTPSTHWIGGWVGPRAGLNDAERRKILPLPGLELRPLGCPARSQSLYRLHYVFVTPQYQVSWKPVHRFSSCCFRSLSLSLSLTLWSWYVHTCQKCTQPSVSEPAIPASLELEPCDCWDRHNNMSAAIWWQARHKPTLQITWPCTNFLRHCNQSPINSKFPALPCSGRHYSGVGYCDAATATVQSLGHTKSDLSSEGIYTN
jgi:hypothetical protein